MTECWYRLSLGERQRGTSGEGESPIKHYIFKTLNLPFSICKSYYFRSYSKIPILSSTTPQPVSPWPHRLAVALCCATFPLIWIGGLVTSHDAGMAVPDWPNTYGYNLFLYPLSTWFFGPWDLFIEHGHRLLASGVGLLTIALVVAVYRMKSPGYIRVMSLAALVLVIVQGVLGGLRVTLDARTLAMLHGCTGPLFFAICVALATVTSQTWRSAKFEYGIHNSSHNDLRLAIAASIATLLTYLQLVLGAQLRHIAVAAMPGQFKSFVTLHLLVAGLLVVQVGYIVWRTMRTHVNDAWLMRPASALMVIVFTQVALGGGAWVTNYGWPSWFAEYLFAAEYTIEAQGRMQANITTAHVAVGSLLLVTALTLSLRAGRRFVLSSLQSAPDPSHDTAHAGAFA